MLSAPLAPVTSFPTGDSVQIEVLGVAEPVACRLRQLGVREGCKARILNAGDKCVLAIGQSRIALRKEVAMGLFAVCCQDEDRLCMEGIACCQAESKL